MSHYIHSRCHACCVVCGDSGLFLNRMHTAAVDIAALNKTSLTAAKLVVCPHRRTAASHLSLTGQRECTAHQKQWKNQHQIYTARICNAVT